MVSLDDQSFLDFAMEHYDNPHCTSEEEFKEDLKRIQYIRKLLGRYKEDGDLKERLILNHLIVLFNCFGPKTTHMLFMKLDDFHPQLAPFISYLNYLPHFIYYRDVVIAKTSLEFDPKVVEILKNI